MFWTQKGWITLRKVLKLSILGLICLFIVYYFYIVIDTHNIMVTLKKIEKGEIVYDYFSKDPLARFGRGRGPLRVEVRSTRKTYKIKRYFTWCWGKQGRIWLTCVDRREWEDGRVYEARDCCSLKIEKVNGEWKVIKYINRP